MLTRGTPADGTLVERVLAEREQLQSTGIGEGVAIPHGALPHLDTQHASLLIVPEGVDFAAIDGQAVNIVFAVIGPKRATGEHLKTLARVSRLPAEQGVPRPAHRITGSRGGPPSGSRRGGGPPVKGADRRGG